MRTIILEGKEIALDNNGRLVNSSEWTRTVAVYLADGDGFMKLGTTISTGLCLSF